MVRNLNSILDSIKNNKNDRIAVLRKNKLEAIIISVEAYDRINELMEFVERSQIYKTIEKRKETPLSEYIDFDQLVAEQGIDLGIVTK